MRFPANARPVAAILGMDPAYSGPAGLAVLVRGPVLEAVPKPRSRKLAKDYVPVPEAHQQGVYLHAHRNAPVLTAAAMRWVGERCAEVCRPGERIIFASEATVFGGRTVCRKLGIGVGAVEGLLIDLNAIDEESRVDLQVKSWRSACGIPSGLGRQRAKQRAIKRAAELFGVEGLYDDEAEAACIAWATHLAYARDACQRDTPCWGMHERPVPSMPTGLGKGRGEAQGQFGEPHMKQLLGRLRKGMQS